MSWTRVSLFTKVTRDPAATVTVRGETAFAEIVIVAGPGVGVGEGDGDGVGDAGVELSPPQLSAVAMKSAAPHSVRKGWNRREPVEERPAISRTSS
jgi:hypothetical protein